MRVIRQRYDASYVLYFLFTKIEQMFYNNPYEVYRYGRSEKTANRCYMSA